MTKNHFKKSTIIIWITITVIINLSLMTLPPFIDHTERIETLNDSGFQKVFLVSFLAASITTAFTIAIGVLIGALLNLIPRNTKSYKERFTKTILGSVLITLLVSIIFITASLLTFTKPL